MTKRIHFPTLALGATLCLTLSACQTVKMPKIDILKSPEFSEEAANISKSYPRVKDAPQAPTDVRSDKQWDKDAREMQALRDTPSPIEPAPSLGEAEVRADFETQKAKAQAYKKDDPVSGPVDIYPPDYQPRR